jgi:hypothetical protein
MKSLILSSFIVFAAIAQTSAEAACMDGRVVRIDCSREKKVLTHYGCEEEFGVQCLPLSEIPLIESVTSGGFRRDPEIDLTSIMRDGKVIQTQKIMERGTQKWKVKSVESMSLGKAILAQIDQSFGVLKAAKYQKSNEPPCMDAPTTEFTAYVSKAGESPEAIPFFKIEGCREILIESEGAYDLKYISQATENLSRIAL